MGHDRCCLKKPDQRHALETFFLPVDNMSTWLNAAAKTLTSSYQAQHAMPQHLMSKAHSKQIESD